MLALSGQGVVACNATAPRVCTLVLFIFLRCTATCRCTEMCIYDQ